MMGWCCSICTTLGGISAEVALSNILDRDLNASLCVCLSVTCGLTGAGFSVRELDLVRHEW